MHGESPIKRRVSRKIWVGSVPVGGDAPIAVQSLTNSDTNDVAATVAQINRLEAAGVEATAPRLAAMTAVWARVVQVWRDDEGALNRTMAELDKRLKQMADRLAKIGAGF